jgi:cellulose synthase (UDP-forming)
MIRPSKLLLIWTLRLEVAAGLIALCVFFSWWLYDQRMASFVYLVWLFFAVLYAGTQLVANWVLYLVAKFPEPPPSSESNISVDVFVSAYQDPPELIASTLAAACTMHGAHHTWLLDDSSSPQLQAKAEQLKAGYLVREGNVNAKAGNLNAALAQTGGEIVVIFDSDHAPLPDFLARSLGFFADPQVGFVQVMLTFSNKDDHWVARAAIETSLEYYNPTSIGAAEIGGASLMGSNALIRRKALESIGGYQPGLAEDLATSLALHAAGWKSAYLAEPLAPGIAPPSYSAWFTQQLKWARGVFELLLTAYPRLFSRLSWGQRLAYIVRMTRYWIGPVVAAHLFATIAVLMFGNPEQRAAFHEYLHLLAPLVILDVLIRFTAFRIYRHAASPDSSLLRAIVLVYATWPVYTLAWAMALLRIPLSYRTTPKSAEGKLHPLWMLPQLLVFVLLVIGTLYTTLVLEHPLSILLFIAILQAALQFVFFLRWQEPHPVPAVDPNEHPV